MAKEQIYKKRINPIFLKRILTCSLFSFFIMYLLFKLTQFLVEKLLFNAATFPFKWITFIYFYLIVIALMLCKLLYYVSYEPYFSRIELITKLLIEPDTKSIVLLAHTFFNILLFKSIYLNFENGLPIGLADLSMKSFSIYLFFILVSNFNFISSDNNMNWATFHVYIILYHSTLFLIV